MLLCLQTETHVMVVRESWYLLCDILNINLSVQARFIIAYVNGTNWAGQCRGPILWTLLSKLHSHVCIFIYVCRTWFRIQLVNGENLCVHSRGLIWKYLKREMHLLFNVVYFVNILWYVNLFNLFFLERLFLGIIIRK